jgi:hypothetical protein
VVDDELQAPKVNGFAKGESNAGLVLAVGGDDEFRRMNHQNVQWKACYKLYFLVCQLSVFSAMAMNMVYKITCEKPSGQYLGLICDE